MSEERIRWGVLSTAKIARNRLIPAIQASRNGAMVAVASREPERARAFAQELEIPRAHGSYQDLLDDPAIDAVYLPLPASLHHEWTLKAAAGGKHVLCDKPFAANATQAQEMVDACRRAGVQLADGFMFRHDPRHARVRELVATGAIGELRRVRAAFAFPIVRDRANVRLAAGLDGGALGDVGCYGVSASCLYFDGLPASVVGALELDREFAVDMDGSALLDFGPNRRAICDFSFITAGRQRVEIVGSDASVTVDKCFIPLAAPGEIRIEYRDRASEEIFQPFNTYVAEVENFGEAVRGRAALVVPGEEGVKNVRVLDAIRASARTGARMAP